MARGFFLTASGWVSCCCYIDVSSLAGLLLLCRGRRRGWRWARWAGGQNVGLSS